MPIVINPTRLNEQTIHLFQAFLKTRNEAIIKRGRYTFPINHEKNEIITLKLTHSLLIHNKKSSALERIEVFGSKIGAGSFSEVYSIIGVLQVEANFKFKKRSENKERIIKVLPLNLTPHHKVQAEAWKTGLASNLDCRQAFFDQKNGYLLMKRAKEIELFTLNNDIREGKITLSLRQMLEITRSLIIAVDQIHKRGFIHRDIKPENLFINLKKLRAMVIDFAFLKSIEKASKSDLNTKGSAIYLAPETLLYGEVNISGDLFALGIALAQFWGDNSSNALDSITEITLSYRDKLLKYHLEKPFTDMFLDVPTPKNIQNKILSLIKGLCAYYIEDRITANEALKQCASLLYLEARYTNNKNRLLSLKQEDSNLSARSLNNSL